MAPCLATSRVTTEPVLVISSAALNTHTHTHTHKEREGESARERVRETFELLVDVKWPDYRNLRLVSDIK